MLPPLTFNTDCISTSACHGVGEVIVVSVTADSSDTTNRSCQNLNHHGSLLLLHSDTCFPSRSCVNCPVGANAALSLSIALWLKKTNVNKPCTAVELGVNSLDKPARIRVYGFEYDDASDLLGLLAFTLGEPADND